MMIETFHKIKLFLIISIIMEKFQVSGPLKILRMDIEKPFLIGKHAQLRCDYALEGSELYSLKWYKNGQEFFRIMPSQSEHTKVFPVPGVMVDTNLSDLSRLVLTNISLVSGGLYRCEVSTEAPHFYTAVESVPATVMALPDTGPDISGVSPSYNIIDTITATCFTTNSLPAANIQWFINSENSNSISHNATQHFESNLNTNRLVDSLSHIRLHNLRKYCNEGKLKLKCVAMLGEIFLKTNEVSLEINGCKDVINKKHQHLANKFAKYFAISDRPPASSSSQSSRLDKQFLAHHNIHSSRKFQTESSSGQKTLIGLVMVISLQLLTSLVV